MSMDSTGNVAVAWADQEVGPGFSFNIALRIYDPSGTIVQAELAGPGPTQWVNDPTVDPLASSQLSPAVAFNDLGDLIVTWVALRPESCIEGGLLRIYARRFIWDAATNVLTAQSAPFIVNSDPAWGDFGQTGANPTVALAPDSGAFVVAWNGLNSATVKIDVRAQYVDANGQPRGREFGVTQLADPPPPAQGFQRRIAESAQHTVAWRTDGSVVVAWDLDDIQTGTRQVFYTMLPPDFALTQVNPCPFCEQNPSACDPCLKADVNDDCVINGLDIQPFVDVLLDGALACRSIVALCAADMNSDGMVDIADIPCFVEKLLFGISSCEGGAGPRGMVDCNGNGVPDANDVFDGTSHDCNGNFVPDECDVDPADPDGNGLVSNDLNTNSIPDECEPDCNGNGVPDDKDIADATSADINANGVPDECDPDCNGNGVPDDADVNGYTTGGTPVPPVSADCNANGRPDECEPDCNSNGVPDDCDIDPTDPDGDGFVSPDCNGNQFPDECDLTLPLFASLDCNANGIPDECDIDPTDPDGNGQVSGDCNGNRFPDECDITSGISQDVNGNGVPDECEQQAQGGGSSPAPGGNGAAVASPEALAAFTDWCLQQQWGPGAEVGCAQQFQRCVDKLAELGLPPADPWR